MTEVASCVAELAGRFVSVQKIKALTVKWLWQGIGIFSYKRDWDLFFIVCEVQKTLLTSAGALRQAATQSDQKWYHIMPDGHSIHLSDPQNLKKIFKGVYEWPHAVFSQKAHVMHKLKLGITDFIPPPRRHIYINTRMPHMAVLVLK